jgi:tagatose-1,6-bisphosphate aldolase non-catalytic subunit AgaZ/GatZ
MGIIDLLFSSKIYTRLGEIYEQGERIMAKVDELLAALEEANVTTNEIADDITALLAQLAAGGLTPAETEQVTAKIAELNARLKGVAAQYPPQA